jgi:hypothetical protein
VSDLRSSKALNPQPIGAHARAIQERMGHSSPMLTLGRYGHLLDGLDDRVAEGLDAAHRERETDTRDVAVARIR